MSSPYRSAISAASALWRGPRLGGRSLPLVGVALVLALAAATLVASGSGQGPSTRSVALDGPPGGLVVDPASGHAFVWTNRVLAPSNTTDPDTRLTLLDLRTGAVTRSIDVGFMIQATAIDARGGRLFIAGENKVLLVDTRNGRMLTSTPLGQAFGGAMVVDARHHRLYVTLGGSGGGVAILDARTGGVVRQVTVGESNGLTALVNMGVPVVDTAAGRVFAPFTAMAYGTSTTGTTAMTGGIVLLDAAGYPGRTLVMGHSATQGNPATLALDPVHHRLLVLDGNTGVVSTLDARSGHLMHRVRLWTPGAPGAGAIGIPWGTWGPWTLDAPAGRLYITTPQRWVCVRRASGSCLPTLRPGDLYLLDTRSGRLLGHLLSGAGPDIITLDARAGRVLVTGSAPGSTLTTLDILDARTGALRHHLLLAPNSMLLLDAGTGRAYVVAGDGVAALDVHSGRLSDALVLDGGTTGSFGLGASVGAVVDGRVIVLHDNVRPPGSGDGAAVPAALAWLPDWLRRWLPGQPAHPVTAPGSVSIVAAPR